MKHIAKATTGREVRIPAVAHASRCSPRPRRAHGLLRVALGSAALLLVGCPEDDPGGAGNSGAGAGGSGGTGGAAGGAYAYNACDAAQRVGGFTILLEQDKDPPYSSITGQVMDGVEPTLLADTVMTVGSCSLLRGRDLFCDPACAVGTVCAEDGSCIPAPAPHDVGAVDLRGLADAVHIEPRPPIFNYQGTGTLQYPVFDEGALVSLTAAGGEFDPFQLVAQGVAPLAFDAESVSLQDGSPVVLQWAPPAAQGVSRVHATLNISLHGGNPVRIECEADDTGSLEIPAALVSELLSQGYSGFPRLEVYRRTADSIELPVGCIDLIAAARETLDVQIPGLISCRQDLPCPEGSTCQGDMTCK